jgi:hypothetical protein
MMDAFTRSTIAAAERDLRDALDVMDRAKRGVELCLLPHAIVQAMSLVRAAAGTLERAVRLDAQVELLAAKGEAAK